MHMLELCLYADSYGFLQCQWEQSTFDARLFDFLPTDLSKSKRLASILLSLNRIIVYSLFDIWFNTRGHTLPLLHQPTFMKNMANGLHYRDGAFAAMVLFFKSTGELEPINACALGSQYSCEQPLIRQL